MFSFSERITHIINLMLLKKMMRLIGDGSFFLCGVVWGAYASSVSYLQQMAVRSLSVWKSSAVRWQETECSISGNTTNSNMFLNHQQNHTTLYMYITYLEF